MKYKFLFQIIPLLAGGMTIGATSTIGESGVFVDSTVKGIPDGEDDYRFSLIFRGTKIGYHNLYVVLSNSLTKSVSSFQNDSTYPGSYVIKDSTWTKQRILIGATKRMDIVVPRKVIADKGNIFYFYNEEYKDSTFTEKSSYMRSTRLDVVKPVNYSLPSSAYLSNGGFSGFSISNGVFKNTAYQIEHRGFQSEIYNPAYNRIPLEYMLIRYKNYLGYYSVLPHKEISLRIYSHIEKFPLWPIKTDGIRRWVDIPLSFHYSYDSFWRPGLKNAVGVTIDGRDMKAVEDMKDGDLLTNDVYLPAVMPNEVNKYSMEILINGCADNLVDTISYKFDLYKSSNELGSCSTSYYCLEEL
ncbi:MAG: hypothetical protein MJ220_02250 [Bacilli bacterium]|nr:hypothetical protein [Bacilli bacterium]